MRATHLTDTIGFVAASLVLATFSLRSMSARLPRRADADLRASRAVDSDERPAPGPADGSTRYAGPVIARVPRRAALSPGDYFVAETRTDTALDEPETPSASVTVSAALNPPFGLPFV